MILALPVDRSALIHASLVASFFVAIHNFLPVVGRNILKQLFDTSGYTEFITTPPKSVPSYFITASSTINTVVGVSSFLLANNKKQESNNLAWDRCHFFVPRYTVCSSMMYISPSTCGICSNRGTACARVFAPSTRAVTAVSVDISRGTPGINYPGTVPLCQGMPGLGLGCLVPGILVFGNC